MTLEFNRELINNSGTRYKYFVPEKSSNKDRFGNQFFSSKEFSYLGNSGENIEAGILISEAGQKFITENPRILHDLDKALAHLESKSFDPWHGIIFGKNQDDYLQKKGQGSQSNFYVLKVGKEKYAIKTQVTMNLINRKP